MSATPATAPPAGPTTQEGYAPRLLKEPYILGAFQVPNPESREIDHYLWPSHEWNGPEPTQGEEYYLYIDPLSPEEAMVFDEHFFFLGTAEVSQD